MQEPTSAIRSKVGLGFGLLNIAVSVHAAVGPDESAGLRTVCHHGHEATPIKQTQTCPECENTDRATFGRAHEGDDGKFHVIPTDVLARAREAAGEFKGKLDLTVHPAADVSGVLLPSGKAYYLSLSQKNPNTSALATYAALAVLVKSRPDLAFMTKYTLSTVVSLFQLVVAGESTLMLRQMADADLIRQHPVMNLPTISAQDVELASMLADQKCEPFVVAQHGTTSNTVIADYIAEQPLVAAETSSEGATVTDLTAALAAMVAAGAKPKAAPKVRAPRAPRKAVQKVS